MEEPVLAVPTVVTTYNQQRDSRALAKLHDELQTLDTFTEVSSINSPADLAVVPETCLVRARYRFTACALGQLCTLLAPGASQLLFNISGLRPNSRSKVYDRTLAVAILNDLLYLRFKQIAGSRVLLNRKTKTIEGIIGPRYRYYSNFAMLRRVADFVNSAKVPVQFTEAVVDGRQFLIRYKCNDPLFALKTERELYEPFFGGYQFENIEAGDCAIKGTTIFIRQWCDNKAVAPVLHTDRVPHIRTAKFDLRLDGMLQRVTAKTQQVTVLKDRVLALMHTKLRLGQTPLEHAARVNELSAKLVRKGLTRVLADRVLNTVIAFGSYRHQALATTTGGSIMQVLAQRTHYDLFNALTYAAKTETADLRLQAEQLGYSLLVGTFTV